MTHVIVYIAGGIRVFWITVGCLNGRFAESVIVLTSPQFPSTTSEVHDSFRAGGGYRSGLLTVGLLQLQTTLACAFVPAVYIASVLILNYLAQSPSMKLIVCN